MTSRWLSCDLDEGSVQQLQAWKDELQTVEEEALVLEGQLDTALSTFLSATKEQATLQFGTLAMLNRLILTATEGGSDIHTLAILLVNPGPNLDYNVWFPSTYVPTITDMRTSDGVDLLYVELATDTLGNVVTGPKRLALEFTAQGYDDEFTSTTPDYYVFFFLIFDFPLPVDEGVKYFSGGTDANMVNVQEALDAFYAGSDLDSETVLEQADVPVAKTTSTTGEILSQISDVIFLATGKMLSKTGDNLVEVRALYEIMGEDSTALTNVQTALGKSDGTPNVVWMQEVSTTTTQEVCDGGQTTTVVEDQFVAFNAKPSRITSDMTPYVWWSYSLTPTVETLKLLTDYGLTNSQVTDALDDSNENTYVLQDDIVTQLSLTSAELQELLELAGVEGVGATEMTAEGALDALEGVSPTAANGYLSAAFNLPGGAALQAALSPEQSMTSSIQNLNDSQCIDPFGKANINSFLAAASATVDSATRIVERVRGKVISTLNKVSGILANLQNVLGNIQAVSCLIGLNVSVKGPQIDILMGRMDNFSIEFKALTLKVENILELVFPKLCELQTAINDLIGPELGLAECLVPGLTNALINAFGVNLNIAICISNPFDFEAMLDELEGKINALSGMVTSMINDMRDIQVRLDLNIDIQNQSSTKSALTDCQGAVMNSMVNTIKSKFGVAG